jgi:peroxiredoxin
MPAFRLEAVNGTTVQATDLLGKVVVVRFWATW